MSHPSIKEKADSIARQMAVRERDRASARNAHADACLALAEADTPANRQAVSVLEAELADHEQAINRFKVAQQALTEGAVLKAQGDSLDQAKAAAKAAKAAAPRIRATLERLIAAFENVIAPGLAELDALQREQSMANPPSEETMSAWASDAVQSLKTDYGLEGAGQALSDARAYIASVPGAADMLDATGLGKGRMLSMGVDVSRGGRDSTVIARRHEGNWFDVPLVYPGSAVPDGPTVAGLVVSAHRNTAAIHIDVIGVGASPFDFLRSGTSHTVVGVNVSEAALGLDQSGRLRFKNQRSELVWRMREALDPANDTGIALPPDKRLRADLAAFTWEIQGTTVFVHSRDQIVKRIGRSPDWASAFVMALIDTLTWDD